MATHSSILAWRIPGTEEPSGLQSMGSHRVGHDRSDLAAAEAAAWLFMGQVIGRDNHIEIQPRESFSEKLIELLKDILTRSFSRNNK